MRVDLGDVSLWFDVSGPSVLPRDDTTVERPTLVAVHGGPGTDHVNMKEGLGPLAEDLQVLYYDQRGHGRSDHSSAEFWSYGPGPMTCGGYATRSGWPGLSFSAVASADSLPSPMPRCFPIIPAASSWPTPPPAVSTISSPSRHFAGLAATRRRLSCGATSPS